MAGVYTARETEISIVESSTITIDTTKSLDQFFSSADVISSIAKNVTIAVPKLEVEKEDYLGETNNFQNQSLINKPVSEAKLTGTLVLDENKNLEDYFMGSGTSIGTTHTRWQVGSSESGKSRVDVSVLVKLNNGKVRNIVFDNARITSLGDKKLGSADGTWEVDFELICLAKDYYEEKEI